MRTLVILCIFLVFMSSRSAQINLPVRSDTQQKLSLSLQRLAQELEYFRTPYENKTSLYKRVALTEQYLQQLESQVSQYNNAIQGQGNSVDGSKNVIVGNYNTLKGSNNYVFIEKYSGQANGDLLIGKWRIQIQKKKLILISSSYAITLINEQANRKYLRYLTEQRTFSYGSSNGDSVVTLIKDEDTFTNSYNYGGSTYQYNNVPTASYGSTGTMVQQQKLSTSYSPTSQTYTSQSNVASSSTTTSSRSSSVPQQPQFYTSQQQQPSSTSSQTYSPVTNAQPVSSTVPQTAYQSQRTSDQSVSTSLKSFPQQPTNTASQPTPSSTQQQSSSPSSQAYVNNNFNNANSVSQTASNVSSNLRSQQAETGQRASFNSRYTRSASDYANSVASTKVTISNSYTNPVSSQAASVNLATWRNRN